MALATMLSNHEFCSMRHQLNCRCYHDASILDLAAAHVVQTHLKSRPCRKLPPTTTESTGVTTACGQPPGMSSVSPAPTVSRTPSVAESAKKLHACPLQNRCSSLARREPQTCLSQKWFVGESLRNANRCNAHLYGMTGCGCRPAAPDVQQTALRQSVPESQRTPTAQRLQCCPRLAGRPGTPAEINSSTVQRLSMAVKCNRLGMWATDLTAPQMADLALCTRGITRSVNMQRGPAATQRIGRHLAARGDVVPHAGAAKVNMEVGESALRAHQRVQQHLRPRLQSERRFLTFCSSMIKFRCILITAYFLLPKPCAMKAKLITTSSCTTLRPLCNRHMHMPR